MLRFSDLGVALAQSLDIFDALDGSGEVVKAVIGDEDAGGDDLRLACMDLTSGHIGRMKRKRATVGLTHLRYGHLRQACTWQALRD